MFLRAVPKRQEPACNELPGDRDPTSHCAHFVWPLERGRLWCTSLQGPTRCLLIVLCNQRLVCNPLQWHSFVLQLRAPREATLQAKARRKIKYSRQLCFEAGRLLELWEGPQRVFYGVLIGKGNIKYCLNPHSLGKFPLPKAKWDPKGWDPKKY